MKQGTQVLASLPQSATDFVETHTSREPVLGSVLGGKYRLEALLGRGGMGVVFRAAHLRTGRIVAIKWLLADDTDTRERFLREARALGTIAHPNVVSILDVGSHDGKEFLVMEFIEGCSLRAHVNEGGRCLSAREAVALLLPALSGLAAVHRAGFVHRDVKPDNLFVCVDRNGEAYDIKLLDFGVVRRSVRSKDEYATLAGYCVGTPRYMAPEQFRADPDVDARADVYAVGVILHELVMGSSPMRAESRKSSGPDAESMETVRAIATEIPNQLAPLLDRMLSWDRDSRFADAGVLGRALAAAFPGLRFVEPRDVHISRGPDSDLGVSLDFEPELSLPPSISEIVRAEAKTPKPIRITPTEPIAAVPAIAPPPRRSRRVLATVVLVATVVLAGMAVALDRRDVQATPEVRTVVAPQRTPVQRVETPPAALPPSPTPAVVAPVLETTQTAPVPVAEPAKPRAHANGAPAARAPSVVHGRSGTIRADEF